MHCEAFEDVGVWLVNSDGAGNVYGCADTCYS